MSASSYLEDVDLIPSELFIDNIPEDIASSTPIAEDHFIVKLPGGKLDKLKVQLYRDILAVCVNDYEKKYVNLSFVKTNYNVETNSSNKYRIDLTKFNHVLSMHTDKLDRVQRWMKLLSGYCVNNDFYTKYQVIELVGQGSFGKVYKVSLVDDPKQEYAAKVFLKSQIKPGCKMLLVNEIRVLQLLSHLNIIAIQEVHETADEIVVVMPLMRAGLLSTFIHNHPKMSNLVIASIMRQLLEGIEYMTFQGIIHRDLKPSNILIEQFDKVGTEKVPQIKIADMGLAVFKNEDVKGYAFAGTHGYMAPELFQLNSKGPHEKIELSTKQDMYSAGVIFYLLITKRNPFKPNDDSDVVKLNEQAKISFDSMHIAKFNKYGVDLLKKMLDKNPKTRISVNEALNHQYFKEEEVSSPTLSKKSYQYEIGKMNTSRSPVRSPLREPKEINNFSKLKLKQQVIDEDEDTNTRSINLISRMRSKSFH